MDGVVDVEINLDRKEVRVTFDPAATSLDAIKGAIEEQGYKVE